MTTASEPQKLAALERRLAELEAENGRLRAALAEDPDGAAAARRPAWHLFEVIEASRQGIVVHRGGPPLYYNLGLIAMLGLASRDAYDSRGDTMTFVHPDDRPLVAAELERHLAGVRLPATGEFRLVRPDGAVVWVEASTSTVAWDGTPAVLTVMNDISARKAAEQEVRRSRRLFQKAFDACPDVMTISELASGRYVDVNRTFLELSGYEREDVIGRTAAELRIFDTESQARFAEALRGQQSMRDLDLRARNRAGELRDYVMSGEVLRFPGQTLVLTVARDITGRRRQEEELRSSREAAERANRSKSQFLAGVSHELRTPLNAIIGFSEVMRDEMFGPLGTPRYAEYAGDVHRSGLHLLEIINDLLDLSKLEAGKLELREEAVDPAALIEDCLRLVRGRAQAGEVRLATALPRQPPILSADPRLLKQIMLNLLSNAVKFTPPGGTVTAAARLAGDGALELQVIDTGIGMNADEVAVALSPFGQIVSGLSRRHEGTGLGLPLARQLARLHGGELRIESEPGAGTTATVTMPAARVRERASATATG